MGHLGGNKQSVGKFVSFKGSLAWKVLDSAFVLMQIQSGNEACKTRIRGSALTTGKNEHCGLYLQVESTNPEV